MYEDGIDVVYELRADVPGTYGVRWTEHRKVTLPGWCAGDPQMGVALHFLGHRSWVEQVRIVDWQPHEGMCDDCGYVNDECTCDEPFPSDRELARREGLAKLASRELTTERSLREQRFGGAL